jgi:hypothetical protein
VQTFFSPLGKILNIVNQFSAGKTRFAFLLVAKQQTMSTNFAQTNICFSFFEVHSIFKIWHNYLKPTKMS